MNITNETRKIHLTEINRRDLQVFMKEHKKALRRSLVRQEGIWAVYYNEDIFGEGQCKKK